MERLPCLHLRVLVVAPGAIKKLFGVYITLRVHGTHLIQSMKAQIISMYHTAVVNLHLKQHQELNLINPELLLRQRVIA